MEESMIGKKVRYRDEVWEVCHIAEESGEVVLVRIDVDVKMGVIKVEPIAVMVKQEEVEKIPHEMTAKEYAEKLKELLGYGARKGEGYCPNMKDCDECPFGENNHNFDGDCEELITYCPDLAVKLMDEWQAKKEKPKGKTYLEDIRERLPNVFINKFGFPEGCRKRLCNGIACTDCMPGMDACRKCWNEVMPEVDNAKG